MMDHLRLVLWLKWKLMFRGFQRNTAALVGAILALCIFAPMSVGLAVVTGIGYTGLPSPTDAYLLRGVLFGIYVFWILAPILGFALNESYDVTKLFPFPIAPRHIFIGAILGSLIDFPVLLLLPLLVAALLGFAHSLPTLLLSLVALTLFLFHTLAVSQAILLLSAAALRSRRWRDVMVVLGPLFALSWYLLTQLLPRYAIGTNWQTLLNLPCWNFMNYLPPGYAALAMGAAERGAWLPALGLLALLAAVTAGAVYLAGHLVQLVSTGEATNGPIRVRRRARGRDAATAGSHRSLFDRRLPPWSPPSLRKR